MKAIIEQRLMRRGLDLLVIKLLSENNNRDLLPKSLNLILKFFIRRDNVRAPTMGKN